ncbi:MAG: DUF1330 domain-containing protein [Gammaproteobacteria bacterium]|nr:DUF1330 domain-containing protein [Gammaproteobacteria bacterium]MBV8307471.1 DUF1330 domain-containing protein [Gammaproteobacteria bacterium]MBV8403328.1 DUF1330 domain-containing protein [Gammaproteobacteria bacterium]
MAAYIIANVQVTDPAVYEEYRRQVPAIIAAYGGRFLARGGQVEDLESGANPQRVVVLEFPDMARLKAFYHSPEYQPLIALRQRASRATLFAVGGV